MTLAPKEIIVGVGEHRVSNDPNTVISTYALGSCLGITAYDAVHKVGGLLHAMLPSSQTASNANSRRGMFVDTGFADLLEDMAELGASMTQIQFKVFGGAKVLQADRFFRIGEKNAEALEALMAEHGYQPAVWEVGGNLNRTIKLNNATGQVRVKMPNQPEFYK